MQHARGFIDGFANGWLWSPGRQSTPNSKLGELFICKKKTTLSAYYIRVTRWLVTHLQSSPIGTNFAGFCSNLGSRGLLSSLSGFFTGCILIGWLQVTRWGQGIPPFHGNRNPNPGRLPAPHNKTYFSASKTNKKNIRHMNYRHW